MGVHKKHHTVTWFGRLSYNKMSCPPLPDKEPDVCPMCGCQLVKLLWVGRGNPFPDVEGGFYVEPGGWVEAPGFRWR